MSYWKCIRCYIYRTQLVTFHSTFITRYISPLGGERALNRDMREKSRENKEYEAPEKQQADRAEVNEASATGANNRERVGEI